MPPRAPEPVLARRHPDEVPVLTDVAAGVTLRALVAEDLPRVVEQCRDPEVVRWTTVPAPDGGYALADAREFLAQVAAGWRGGEHLVWAVESHDRPGVFCGSIALHLRGAGLGEVGYGLHPDARGRHLMTGALRLVRDFGFDVAGLPALLWQAAVGNWASRRVAAAAGWPCEGVRTLALVHRGERLDGWAGTLRATDPRGPRGWVDPPVISGPRLRLRPFTEADADRVAEACRDPRTQHWLSALAGDYTAAQALAYVEGTREAAAAGRELVWCAAAADDDRCLASISLHGLGVHARRAEIGYWAHPDARGRGVVGEAVRRVAGWVEETGRLDSLVIRAAAGNTASRRVAETAGFREVGVLPRCEPLGDGTLADLVLYARP